MVGFRVVAALAVALAWMGRSAAQGMDPAPCRELLAGSQLFPAEAVTKAAIERPDASTCVYMPMRVALGSRAGYSIDRLTARGLLGAEAGRAVRIEAQGVRNAPLMASPVTAYILRVGAVPFDLVIDYATDPTAQTFTLNEFSLRGAALGLVSVETALTGVTVAGNPLLAGPAMPDPAAVGLRSLSFRIDNRGFVEHMVVPFVAGLAASLGPGGDPAPVIEAQQAQLAGVARSLLPSMGMTAESTEAVARFVLDFPHPSGSFRCSLAADRALRLPVDGTSMNQASLAAVVAAGHPACSYAPG